MALGSTIKQVREQRRLLQKQVAAELGYNKLENDNRESSVKELQALAKLFDMSIDPKEVQGLLSEKRGSTLKFR